MAKLVKAELLWMVLKTLEQLTPWKLTNVPSLYIWSCLFFWAYCQGWYAFPCSIWEECKAIYFCLGIFFLFQQHFLSFNFKQSLANLCTFQRLFRTGYDTVCTPDKYLSSVVFIVTELAIRGVHLQILVPPTRSGAEGELGVMGPHYGDSRGSGSNLSSFWSPQSVLDSCWKG